MKAFRLSATGLAPQLGRLFQQPYIASIGVTPRASGASYAWDNWIALCWTSAKVRHPVSTSVLTRNNPDKNVPRLGFTPPTSGLTGGRSNQCAKIPFGYFDNLWVAINTVPIDWFSIITSCPRLNLWYNRLLCMSTKWVKSVSIICL